MPLSGNYFSVGRVGRMQYACRIEHKQFPQEKMALQQQSPNQQLASSAKRAIVKVFKTLDLEATWSPLT